MITLLTLLITAAALGCLFLGYYLLPTVTLIGILLVVMWLGLTIAALWVNSHNPH